MSVEYPDVSAAINALSRLAVPAFIGVSLLQASLYDVPGGHRAIIFDRFSGVREEVRLALPSLLPSFPPGASLTLSIGMRTAFEGRHPLPRSVAATPHPHGNPRQAPSAPRPVPSLPSAVPLTLARATQNISTTTGSKDLQTVSLTLRVMFRPDTRHLATIYRSLGTTYDERVLPSIGNEVLKATVAQFDAAELITQREVVSARIREDLLKRAGEFNIVLEDVSLTHMTFGKDFTQAVEQKQIAQQEAERAKFVVERSEQERQAAVVRAEGEAEAATIISRALSKAGDGLVQFRRIEASKEIAATLANGRNVTYLPGGGNVLLQVPPQ
ncbi:SPOSA6832_02323, partial [Sporobolomyces salmonicolor]